MEITLTLNKVHEDHRLFFLSLLKNAKKVKKCTQFTTLFSFTYYNNKKTRKERLIQVSYFSEFLTHSRVVFDYFQTSSRTEYARKQTDSCLFAFCRIKFLVE